MSSRGILDSKYHKVPAAAITTTMTTMSVRRIQRRVCSANGCLTIRYGCGLIDRLDHLIGNSLASGTVGVDAVDHARRVQHARSEERRVGKECRPRGGRAG